MLKSAMDESNHLLHEIGNAADAARRTAVKLRGRETGAWGSQRAQRGQREWLTMQQPMWRMRRLARCKIRLLCPTHACRCPAPPAEVTQRDLEAVA